MPYHDIYYDDYSAYADTAPPSNVTGLFDGIGLPRVVVAAAFGPSVSGVCIRGSGVRGTSLRGGRAAVDISADVRSVTWTRGRPSDIDPAEPGTATVLVGNLSGDYDPTNLSGPYVDGGVSLVDLGVEMTIRAEWPTGMLYDRFDGEIVDIQVDAGLDPTVTFTLADGLEKLGRNQLPVEAAEFAGDSSGERIGHLADRADWPAVARLLDHGQVGVAPTVLGASALELMRQVETSEFGLLFVDAHGNLVFYQRHRATTAARSVVVQLSVTDTSGAGEVGMAELVLAKSRERVFNDIHVTRDPDPSQDPELTGSEPGDVPVEQVAQNTTTIGTYGTLSLPVQVGQLLHNDPDALGLAAGLTGLFGSAQVRIREVRVNALHPRVTSENLWPKLLGLELLDRVAVSRDYGPNTITGELLVQQITETVTADPPTWELRLSTSEPPPLVHYCTRGEGVRGTDQRGW